MGSSVPPERTPAVLHAWRIHPAGERPVEALLVAAFVLATATLAALAFRDLFLGGLALLIFSLSLSTYFLPTRYELREGEISVRYPFSSRCEPLAKFRSVIGDRNGLLLSPARDHALVHELRSLFLIVPGPERETVKRLLLAGITPETPPDSCGGRLPGTPPDPPNAVREDGTPP